MRGLQLHQKAVGLHLKQINWVQMETYNGWTQSNVTLGQHREFPALGNTSQQVIL